VTAGREVACLKRDGWPCRTHTGPEGRRWRVQVREAGHPLRVGRGASPSRRARLPSQGRDRTAAPRRRTRTTQAALLVPERIQAPRLPRSADVIGVAVRRGSAHRTADTVVKRQTGPATERDVRNRGTAGLRWRRLPADSGAGPGLAAAQLRRRCVCLLGRSSGSSWSGDRVRAGGPLRREAKVGCGHAAIRLGQRWSPCAGTCTDVPA